MPDQTNILTTLQEEAVEFLRAHSALAEIDSIAEDRKDLLTAINTAVKKLGICLVINTAQANVTNPNLSGPHFDQIRFSVDVVENVTLNRAASGSGVTALNAAVEVCKALHHKRPTIGGGAIYCDNPTIEYRDDRALLVYRVNFKIGT